MKNNEKKVSRRDFMNQMGLTVGAAAVAGAAGAVVAPQLAEAAMPKGKITDKPFKTGHITFLTGAAAILADQSSKGTSSPRKRSTPVAGSWVSARSKPSRRTRRRVPTPTSRKCGA